MSYQKKYWEKVKHNREVDEAFNEGKAASYKQLKEKLTQTQARLEEAERLLDTVSKLYKREDIAETNGQIELNVFVGDIDEFLSASCGRNPNNSEVE